MANLSKEIGVLSKLSAVERITLSKKATEEIKKELLSTLVSILIEETARYQGSSKSQIPQCEIKIDKGNILSISVELSKVIQKPMKDIKVELRKVLVKRIPYTYLQEFLQDFVDILENENISPELKKAFKGNPLFSLYCKSYGNNIYMAFIRLEIQISLKKVK